MKRKQIAQAVKCRTKVLLKGWVHRKRHQKDMAFIILRDASGILQCTIKQGSVDKESWRIANAVNIESSVELSGRVKPDKRAPGGYELIVDRIRFISKGEPFPIARDFSPEYLLDVRHLWLRSKRMSAIMKVRSTVTGAIHDFFRGRG